VLSLVLWFSVVELVLDDDDEALCVDPGRFSARASAPATPETPTADVTTFIRVRSRLRALLGCWDIAGTPSAGLSISLTTATISGADERDLGRNARES
jgi:hypothetical protein